MAWVYETLIHVLILAEAEKGGVECAIHWRIREVKSQTGLWAANFVLVNQTPTCQDLGQGHPRLVIFAKLPHSLLVSYDFVLSFDVKLDRERKRA